MRSRRDEPLGAKIFSATGTRLDEFAQLTKVPCCRGRAADETNPDDLLGVPKLRRILQHEGVETVRCPMCGQENWAFRSDVGLPVLEGHDSQTGEVAGLAGSMHILVASCMTCGFVAPFDYEVLDAKDPGGTG